MTNTKLYNLFCIYMLRTYFRFHIYFWLLFLKDAHRVKEASFKTEREVLKTRKPSCAAAVTGLGLCLWMHIRLVAVKHEAL